MNLIREQLTPGVDREQLAALVRDVCSRYSASVMVFDAEGSVYVDVPDYDAKQRNMQLCGNNRSAQASCTRLRFSMVQRTLDSGKAQTCTCPCGATVVARPIAASSALFGGVIVCLPPGEASPSTGDAESWVLTFVDTLTAVIAQNSFKEVETSSLSNELSLRYEELSLLYEIAEKLPLQTSPQEIIDFLINQISSTVDSRCICWVGVDTPDKFYCNENVSTVGAGSLRARRLAEDAAGITAEKAIRGGVPMAFNNLLDEEGLSASASEFGAVLAVPVTTEDDAFGSVCLFRKHGEEFTSNESLLLASLSRKAASVLCNSKLYGQLNALFLNTLKTLVLVIEGKDAYTSGHSERVNHFSVMLAERMGLSRAECDRISWSALLHDIGKIRVPEAILQKKGKLTDAEWLVIKEHPVFGEKMLYPIEQLCDSLPEIRHHHERFDGNGYPDGIKGEDIPLGARIIAVADTFDALTSDRCYRPRFNSRQALHIIREVAGEQLDPDVTEALLSDSAAFLMHCQRKPKENEVETNALITTKA